jgi:four helix bundle protein
VAAHFKDLIVWQRAMDLVAEVYRATEKFPQHEIYSLTNQIRREAVSIPSNIAEGQAHYSKAEFLHFLRHAAGSLAELETQLMLSECLGYGSVEIVEPLLAHTSEVGKLLNGLIRSLKPSSQ